MPELLYGMAYGSALVGGRAPLRRLVLVLDVAVRVDAAVVHDAEAEELGHANGVVGVERADGVEPGEQEVVEVEVDLLVVEGDARRRRRRRRRRAVRVEPCGRARTPPLPARLLSAGERRAPARVPTLTLILTLTLTLTLTPTLTPTLTLFPKP